VKSFLSNIGAMFNPYELNFKAKLNGMVCAYQTLITFILIGNSSAEE
jgi:hypothetical protein